MFFMMNLVQEKIFVNEEKHTPPMCEPNTGNYSYFSELNENITRRVRFGDGSCVSIKGKGSILFQGKKWEPKVAKGYLFHSRSS